MFKIRWVRAMSIMLIALAVLFGGWSLYRTFGLMRPLQAELLSNPVVSNVEFAPGNKNRELTLTLKQVDDLRKTYHTLSNVVINTLGTDAVIHIEGHPSPELQNFYESLEPTIYEGIAKKNYSEMIDTLQKESKSKGITLCKVTMDRQNFYIQLGKGSDFLYQVVSYNTSTSDKIGVPSQITTTSTEVTTS